MLELQLSHVIIAAVAVVVLIGVAALEDRDQLPY